MTAKTTKVVSTGPRPEGRRKRLQQPQPKAGSAQRSRSAARGGPAGAGVGACVGVDVGVDVGVVMVFVRVRVGHGCRGEAQQDSFCCWIPRPHVITIRSSRSGPGCVSGH